MPKSTRPVKNRFDDPLAEILASWRLWLLGAALGALLAWVLYQVVPPPFRAQATVVVDANLEEAWVYFPDRQLFQFLARETERLEELAWSDAVVQSVSAKTGVSVAELRQGALQLSQPSDGGWHFYAENADAAKAQTTAGAWAEAFVGSVQVAVTASPALEEARAALEQAVLDGETDQARLNHLMQAVSTQYENTKGISFYTEVALSQRDHLPVERSVGLGTYLLVGSVVGALSAPLWIVLCPTYKRR